MIYNKGDRALLVRTMTMTTLKTLLKIFLHIGLFLIFLFDYGLPSINKYLDEKTIRIKSREETGGIEAPSITLSAMNPDIRLGWLNKSQDISHHNDTLRLQCLGFSNISECIREAIY